MIVPIWASPWEIECCHPDAIVGERWEAPLVFDPDPRVWWARDAGISAGPEAEQLGLVELDVTPAPSPERFPLFRHGTLTFAAKTGLEEGHYVGRLWLDAHSDYTEDRTARGTVSRLDVVPLRYELVSDRMYEVREQFAPRSVRSTRERSGRPRSLEEARRSGGEFLVWLEVD